MSRTRVLLVDDHVVVRDGLRTMLGGAEDIEIAAEAASAEDALALARRDAFDVAIVDIALPGRDGLELLKWLRGECPRLQVLVMSMYSEDLYAIRALKYGAAGYLTKNAPASVVVAAVRKVAKGGKWVDPGLAEKLAITLSGAHPTTHDALSNRELEVLRLIASGRSLTQIAEALRLSPKTVTTYRARILEKTGARSNPELTRYALEHGILA